MELRVFKLFVTCCLACILCRNTVGISTLAKVFPSINHAFEPDVRISEIGNTRTKESIKMETRPNEITSKYNSLKAETVGESPLVEDLLSKKKILTDFKKSKCSRYCIQELGSGKDFEDINLILLFADENGHVTNDYFSLKNSSNFKILRHLSTDNEKSTILNYCQIYLNLNCDIVNTERYLITKNNEFYSNSKFNRQNVEILKNYFSNIIPEFSKKLEHKINLSGYTETNFQTDANVTGIAINILGNLTRIVLTISSNNRMIEKPGIVISLASTYNPKGVAIGARNLPDRWCVKLTGMENSKYNLDVIAYYGANKENNTRDDIININSTSEINREKYFFNEKPITQTKTSTMIKENHVNTFDNSANLINSTVNKKRKFIFERSVDVMDLRRNNDENNFSDISLSSHESTVIDKKIVSHSLHNNSLISYGEFKILPNSSNIKEEGREQKIQARSSEIASLNEDTKMKLSVSETLSMQMDSDQSQKLSTEINSFLSKDSFERRKIMLDVNANSKLIAAPGTPHRVIFDATNNCVLPVRYVFQARSSPFRIYNIQPMYMWLGPGQTNQVAVDIVIPAGTQETVNTLTLFIAGTEISEKTVQIFVQNAFSKNIDNVKPTIEYWFNSNCAGKLDKDRCEKTLWSADITVQDYDSGLKRVIAIPNGLYSRTQYISGTKERVTFYYSSTCCTPTATITAIDISENEYTRSIDVTAWDNLSQGEIAAVVLGALLLLLLLIAVIVAIVYCVRKRSSHDLPYTQRYGSRSQPARSERTSF